MSAGAAFATATQRLGPAGAAFICSLVLSWIAVAGAIGPNRDGMLYVDTARLFVDGGLSAALGSFDWPFFPVLIGAVSAVSGLGPETSGFLIGAMLMAGLSAAVVAVSGRLCEGTAWAACLVVLAMPAFNEYRDHLLREFGFWCFSFLAILCALRWRESVRWRDLCAMHGAVLLAALFRLEALIIYFALAIWSWGRRREMGWQGVLGVIGIPFVVVVVGVVAYVIGGGGVPARFASYAQALDPVAKIAQFDLKADLFARTLLPDYQSDAGKLLFLGFLALLAYKFIAATGILFIPFAYALTRQPLMRLVAQGGPLPWLFAAYATMLMVFATHQFFLSARYVAFLNLLAVPLIAFGFAELLRRFARWRVGIIALGIVSALVNVVSISPPKTQFRDAGHWLAERVADRGRIYLDNGRVAYFAGWPYRATQWSALDRTALGEALQARRFDLVVLASEEPAALIDAWAAQHEYVPCARFDGPRGESVYVYGVTTDCRSPA